MTGFTIYKAKNDRHLYTHDEYREYFQMADWSTLQQLLIWFYGEEVRSGRTETLLKRWSEAGKIRRKWFDGRYVYCNNRTTRQESHLAPDYIYHGLGVTEGLVRLWKSDPGKKTYLPAYSFTVQRPEFGIVYPTGQMLLYEFCTADNLRKLKTKLERYHELLHKGVVVLFVCDTTSGHLARLLDRYQPHGPFYFCDYQTFKKIPLGQQLTAKVYMTRNGLEALRDV